MQQQLANAIGRPALGTWRRACKALVAEGGSHPVLFHAASSTMTIQDHRRTETRQLRGHNAEARRAQLSLLLVSLLVLLPLLALVTMAFTRKADVAAETHSASVSPSVVAANSVVAGSGSARGLAAGDAGAAVGALAPTASADRHAATLGDGWRRTSVGWEQLPPPPPVLRYTPSRHITLSQAWPAAWAACMLLSIIGAASLSKPGARSSRTT
jgi:hypothetical protein